MASLLLGSFVIIVSVALNDDALAIAIRVLLHEQEVGTVFSDAGLHENVSKNADEGLVFRAVRVMPFNLSARKLAKKGGEKKFLYWRLTSIEKTLRELSINERNMTFRFTPQSKRLVIGGNGR